ncbi:protocadherin Fat 4 [Biomphalaria glabrata]|nr:protocadherin Fat 4 [Biomphalaria glabrata]
MNIKMYVKRVFLFVLLCCHLHSTSSFDVSMVNKIDYVLEDASPMDIDQIRCTSRCSCSLDDTTTFQVISFNTTIFRLRYYNGPLSAVNTPYYDLNITCTTVSPDEYKVGSLPLRIFVRQNNPPVIDNGTSNQDHKRLDSKGSYLPGSIVYSVRAHELENQLPLRFRISSTSPTTNIFQIGQGSGDVTTNVDLREIVLSDVTLTIEVSDSTGKTSQFILFLTILTNKPPNISNLPQTITWEENKPGSNVLIFEPKCVDPDGTPLILTCTITPSSETSKFDVSSKDYWYIKAPLDYEKTKQIQITCTLSDSYLQSEQKVLTILVLDVNEPPYFVTTLFDCLLEESNAGVSSCFLDIQVEDPEHDSIRSIDVRTASNTGSCIKFRYILATKILTFNADYDLEIERKDKCDIELEAKDEHGLVSSNRAKVHVTITDVNDNTCIPSMPGIVTITNLHTMPHRVTTLMARDDDYTDPNNKVTFELVTGQPSEAINHFSVSKNGEIFYFDKIPESNNGKGFALTIKCVDGGRPQRSAEATLLVKYEWTTTTSTTTTTTTTTTPSTTTTVASSSDDPFDNTSFVALFVVLMILLTAGLIGLLVYFIRYRGLCGITPSSSQTLVEKMEPSNKLSNETIYSETREVMPAKINNQYRDTYWNNGDFYETGAGHTSSLALTQGSKRLALGPPPSRPRPVFNF